jgi:hypothetical protein
VAHWVAVVMLPGEHADWGHAESVARLLYNSDLVACQSVASWQVGEAERQIMAKQRRILRADEDGA